MEIFLDSHLRVPISEIDQKWILPLKELISIPNEAKDRAILEHVWGAEKLPDEISLIKVEGDDLLLPRGFTKEFIERIDAFGLTYKIQDRQTSSTFDANFKEIKFKEGQSEAVEAITKEINGRISAPPGTGKTVIVLAAISRIKERALIIVDKSNIMKQWRDRAQEHLGYEVGQIGDGEWQEKNITIAMQQTLWSRKDELDGLGWWEEWGFVCLDECHHIPATTFYETVSSFPARYRIGISATKGKSPAKAKVAEFAFGPIIYETTENNLKPVVKVIETDFQFNFHQTQKIDNLLVRNNYQKLIKALVNDPERNELIVSKILEDQSSAQLIVSKRISHLQALRSLLENKGYEGQSYMLTGKETSEERMQIYNLAAEGSCAIFSTIADEALDIPRLDRIHLVFPSKNPETIKQQVGRILRDHENKQFAIVYDYLDADVPVLKNQYKTRLRKYYQINKFEIEYNSR